MRRGDPYIDKPSTGVDQEKCFGLVGEGGGKLALMLRGILMGFLQSPPGCREDQTHLHLQDQIVEEEES